MHFSKPPGVKITERGLVSSDMFRQLLLGSPWNDNAGSHCRLRDGGGLGVISCAMVCYITYTALDWSVLSTSVLTCFIAALSTIGASRQKQVLRLSGAFIGGILFGMGAQVFVLPYLDTIAGFTLLFAVVTAVSAWI
jgi:hypothetical protein